MPSLYSDYLSASRMPPASKPPVWEWRRKEAIVYILLTDGVLLSGEGQGRLAHFSSVIAGRVKRNASLEELPV
jgi:hypothetical protein